MDWSKRGIQLCLIPRNSRAPGTLPPLVHGSTIAQAVSRWFPTAATRDRAWVRSCGICGGQSGTRPGFLRVLRFPLPIRIPSIAPHSSTSEAGTIGQNSGRSTKWTQSHPMRRGKDLSVRRLYLCVCTYVPISCAMFDLIQEPEKSLNEVSWRLIWERFIRINRYIWILVKIVQNNGHVT
jgi:hypothetical protein